MDDIVQQLREAHAKATDEPPNYPSSGMATHNYLFACGRHMPAILDRLESAEARDAEQRAEIERLRNSLRAIRKHQRIIAPSMMTTVERIAEDALAASKGGEK